MEEKIKKNKKIVAYKILSFLLILASLFLILWSALIYVALDVTPVTYYKNLWGTLTSKKLEGTVYLKDVPIYLEGDPDFSQYSLEVLRREVPDVLLENCEEIYVCVTGTNSTCDQEYAKHDWSNAPTQDVGAFTVMASQKVYIFNNQPYGIFLTELSSGTFIHELMHLYDQRYSLSTQEEVCDLYRDYAEEISDYATSNCQEFLADAARKFFLAPKKLEKKSRPVYDYFQDLFHYYQ